MDDIELIKYSFSCVSLMWLNFASDRLPVHAERSSFEIVQVLRTDCAVFMAGQEEKNSWRERVAGCIFCPVDLLLDCG